MKQNLEEKLGKVGKSGNSRKHWAKSRKKQETEAWKTNFAQSRKEEKECRTRKAEVGRKRRKALNENTNIFEKKCFLNPRRNLINYSTVVK